ncbi:MAG: hypothetical protein HZC01_00810 [Candidatus Kerfeldbacteria bacterium]|nr:hypothetical protein [Candidatus Kerfeldbacteria bacterium]
MNFFAQRGISTFWGISIILMEVTIVLFVFYILYFFWIENPTPTSNILIIKTFRSNVVRIPESVDTSGWQQYTSDELSIAFKYPDDYTLFEDSIAYGVYEGTLIELRAADAADSLSFKAFPLTPGEIEDETPVGKIYQRLTGVSPNIYQSYTEKVADEIATVYRQTSGDPNEDNLFFINANNLFEIEFNEASAQILATVTL